MADSEVVKRSQLRVIVAGSRDFTDTEWLENVLDEYTQKWKDTYEIVFISGCARGADSLVIEYAKKRGFPCKEFPAKWELYGKSAGFRRNREMLEYAVSDGAIPYLIAFLDGKSKGTADMLSLSRRFSVNSNVILYDAKNRLKNNLDKRLEICYTNRRNQETGINYKLIDDSCY